MRNIDAGYEAISVSACRPHLRRIRPADVGAMMAAGAMAGAAGAMVTYGISASKSTASGYVQATAGGVVTGAIGGAVGYGGGRIVSAVAPKVGRLLGRVFAPSAKSLPQLAGAVAGAIGKATGAVGGLDIVGFDSPLGHPSDWRLTRTDGASG